MNRSAVESARRYGEVTLYELVEIALKVLLFPIFLIRTFVVSAFTDQTKYKTYRRIFTDMQLKYFLNNLKVNQLQWVFGDSVQNCIAWSEETGVPLQIEQLEEDGILLWMGKKEEADEMVLHCPAGGYVLPVTGAGLSYLHFVQRELRRKGKRVVVAMLVYSVIPTKPFPVPLRQLVFGLQRVTRAGFHPSRITLLGESAGGNLILQLLSHLLHPHPRVPRMELSAPLRSAYMMSPWITLVDDTARSMTVYEHMDYITLNTLNYWGELVLRDVPGDERPYPEASSTPSSWWSNSEKVIERVLLTAGGCEILKEECISFAEKLKRHHNDFTFVVQPNAPHADPLVDFVAGEKNFGEVMHFVVDWIAAGM